LILLWREGPRGAAGFPALPLFLFLPPLSLSLSLSLSIVAAHAISRARTYARAREKTIALGGWMQGTKQQRASSCAVEGEERREEEI